MLTTSLRSLTALLVGLIAMILALGHLALDGGGPHPLGSVSDAGLPAPRIAGTIACVAPGTAVLSPAAEASCLEATAPSTRRRAAWMAEC